MAAESVPAPLSLESTGPPTRKRDESKRSASVPRGRSQQEQAQLQHMVERGREYLFNKVPEWKDAQKWNEARSKLRDYGQKVGYTDEELGAAYDPRAILVLDKARRYDAIMANRPKPDQSAGPKPMRSGTIANTPRAATEFSRAKDRLSRTGSVDDAAKLFGLLDRRK